MESVSIVSCPQYDPAVCRAALVSVLEPLGGLSFVQQGMTVGIKANLVSFMKPEAAATTHPVLLAELVKLLKEQGAAKVIVGDSPGGLYTAAYVKNVYRATGMHQVEQVGGVLNNNFEQKTAEYPQGLVAKSFTYTAWLDDCDVLIDFCKLKSHGMMGMSAAAKNMFGIIPGTMKPEYHYKYPDPRDFARMLVDLDEYTKPVLSLVDGVVGMDGNGPTMGNPKPMGVLLASRSPHAVDLACAHIIGLQRADVPTLEAAYERGLIPAEHTALTVYGDLESFCVPDFDNVRTKNDLLFRNEFRGKAGELFGKLVQKCMCAIPRVAKDQCVGCGKCGQICPAHAITMKNRLPVIDRSVCIHCFCCQEFCPKGAMKVSRPLVARILNK
jgi:uncharacterized protein (DUF362 family)/ferredoxin